MTLVTTMTVLVKFMGASYPAPQIVFIRSAIGLVLVLPLMWRRRADLLALHQPGRNALRVVCNAIALNANFLTVVHLPLAMASALGYLRPVVTLLLAIPLLGEKVPRRRWIGAGLVIVGVVLSAWPALAGLSAPLPGIGLAAAGVMILFGSLAVIQTRALRQESPTVMMLFYTVGVTALTAIPAAIVWQPVARADWGALLAIGLLSQAGQYCFLRAYRVAEASYLAPVSYASIVFATAAGWIAFGDRPGVWQVAGAAVIVASLVFVLRRGQSAAAS